MNVAAKHPEAGKRAASRGAGLALFGPLALRHRVRVTGEGHDIVVLSHGFGTDQTAWRGVYPALADRFTCVLYDLPGAGPLLPNDFDPLQYGNIGRFSDDLLALLDELGVRRCTFIGHSVSAMVGALASIEAPDMFKQLAFLNASPRYLNAEGYRGGFERADLDGLFAAMAANYQGWVAGFAPAAVGHALSSAVMDFAQGLLAMRPDVATQIARMIFESDLRALLPMIEVPTLILHSRNDIAVPPEVAGYLHEQIDRSELALINAEGHLPHLSAPQAVLEVLRERLH